MTPSKKKKSTISADDMIQVVDCVTAEEFLEEMSVSKGRLWTEARRSTFLTHDWVLRGMTRASWPLQPSAFRKNAFCKLWPGQLEYTSQTGSDQRDHEDAFVMEFASHADQMVSASRAMGRKCEFVDELFPRTIHSSFLQSIACMSTLSHNTMAFQRACSIGRVDRWWLRTLPSKRWLGFALSLFRTRQANPR